MSNIRFGCQTYTWLMSGEKYKGRIPHILDVAKRAGFGGLETEVVMLRDLSDPLRMKDAIAAAGIELGAICLVEDWRGPEETSSERANADHYIDFMRHFPGAMFALCQMPGSDRSDLRERQQNLLACVNEIARRAAGEGVSCTYHPNSPDGSIYRTSEDYEILLNGLAAGVIGYAPDSGHIARAGMDPLAIIKKYRERVNHVHFKDMDAGCVWAAMGAGVLDFHGIVSFLRDTEYDGWIMVEDECHRAEVEPDAATMDNGRYIRETLAAVAQMSASPVEI
jgi:inosose dehydratase